MTESGHFDGHGVIVRQLDSSNWKKQVQIYGNEEAQLANPTRMLSLHPDEE